MKNLKRFRVGDKVTLIGEEVKHLGYRSGEVIGYTENGMCVVKIDDQLNAHVYEYNLELSNCQSNKCESSPIQKAIDYLERLKGSESLDKQVGGEHYKKFLIQPFIFHRANKLQQAEANAIDYILRAKDKNGVEDLKKAIHYIEMIIDTDYGE